MKKILLLSILACFSCFAAESEADLNEIKANQDRQLFYLQVNALLLGCISGVETVKLMIHAKNQKSLI